MHRRQREGGSSQSTSARFQEGLRDWLVLIQAPRIGPRTFVRLVEHFGSPGDVLRASRAQLTDAGLKDETIARLRAPDEAQLDLAEAWLQQPGTHILTLADARYPAALREIPDPPPLLYVRGDASLLDEPQVAIVGSRNPTRGGCDLTAELARDLARCGLVVTSGLAIGIDGVAHAAALEAGRTIAVLGTGLDLVYPAAHRDLARRIAEVGALVSEQPPGQGALARNFPRRNRIISGLSLGVLVTEATLKSGSLITARAALEQGRDVLAVPGSINSPLSKGCHALIREGAKLVQSAEEVLIELAPQLRALIAADGPGAHAPEQAEAELDAESLRLLDAMGFDPVSPDELIERAALPVDQISSMLLLMELDGHVSSLPGGRYCRRRARG